MTHATRKNLTLAGIVGAASLVASALGVLVNWAIDTDARLGNGDKQRAAFVQADSSLFASDSLQWRAIARLERAAGLKGSRRAIAAPPKPPPREGVLKKLFHLFF